MQERAPGRKEQRRALVRLKSVRGIERFYLAGGTAIAVHLHVLRALTYFDDAEKDPVYPRGLTPAKWERIKSFFLVEAPRLLLGK